MVTKLLAKLIYPIFRELVAMHDGETMPDKLKSVAAYSFVADSSECESVNTTAPAMPANPS